MLWATASSADVTRVDPPYWWVGMASNELQLMLYGEDISAFNVATRSDSVRIINASKGDSDNYLFVELSIDKNAQAGSFDLIFSRDDGTEQLVSYDLLERADNSASRQGFNAKDSVYLIVPDRFANGDPNNDELSSLHEGKDWQDPYGRHGGDLIGITNHLDYVEDLGMTQIWMTPVLENNQLSSSYHGYAATDLYNVDARLGGNDAYIDLVQKAKLKGIGVIHDFVPNHIGSEHPWMADLPTDDWISPATYRPTNHRRETQQDPYATEVDKRAMTSGWFVPTMPDLNQSNPKLQQYLIQNAVWWVETAGLSGLRVDTWPYNEKTFLKAFTNRLLTEYPDLGIVGEEWSLNPAIVAYWQRGKDNPDGYNSGAPHLMDFPLQAAIREAVTEEENWNTGLIKLYQTLANDFLYPDPMSLMVIADNHDMGRLYQGVGENFARYKMAMTFLATTRGIPQFLYGTEILMSNPANESHGLIRSDFPGGWEGDEINAFQGEGLSAEASEAQQFVRKLMRFRREATAIHNGDLLHYAPKDGLYVYFRSNADQRLMIVLNNGSTDMLFDAGRYNEGVAGSAMAMDVMKNESFKLSERIRIKPKSARIFELSKGE